MLDKVEEKIRELEKMQREEYNRKKKTDLDQWGLTTQKSGGKTAPLVVTDEEYAALVKASNGVGMPSRNPVAKTLNVAALCMLSLGIIVGFALLNFTSSLGWVYLLVSVLVGAILSLIFRGISEAIRLLQQLADDRLQTNVQESTQATPEFPSEQPDVSAQLAGRASFTESGEDDDEYKFGV